MRPDAVDRLFKRLAATYGSEWDRQLGLSPIGDTKAAWAHELSMFSDRLEAVAWALENLPERCPNVIAFKNLCKQAPAKEVERLPEPKADPVRLRKELEKLGGLIQTTKAAQIDRKDWARRIVTRAEAGERITPISLIFARQALARTASAGDDE